MRIPIKATARMPINRPDTYERLLEFMRNFTCDRQPVHTLGARRRHGQQGSSFDKACGDYVLPLRPRRTNRAISLTSCSLAPPRATTFMPDFRVNSMRPTVSALRSRLNSPDSMLRRTWSANAATTARPARSFKALISRSDRPNSAIDPISLGQNRLGSS